MNGTISRIFSDKGFGFIKCDEDGKEYFFHRQDCTTEDFDDLVIAVDSGQRVEVSFNSVPSPKGPRAADINRTDLNRVSR